MLQQQVLQLELEVCIICQQFIHLVGSNNLDEKLNTSGSAGSGTSFYFDYQGGEYGYNTSSVRGADTFHPFKSGSDFELPPVLNLGTAKSFNLGGLFGDAASQFTANDFYIEPVSCAGASTTHYSAASGSTNYCAGGGCTVSKAYSSGTISYSGNSQNVNLMVTGVAKRSATQEFNCQIKVSIPGVQKTDLGAVTSYNASSISGYENLTVNNFVIDFLGIKYANTASNSSGSSAIYSSADGFSISKSYNAATGLFTFSGASQTLRISSESTYSKATAAQGINFKVWLIR